MNIKTVNYFDSSDLFDKICMDFELDTDNFAGEFSDACTSVSYGDASNTLINVEKFGEILEGMEHFSENPEWIDTIKSWIPDGVLICLEN